MSNIFELENFDGFSEKINIDSLYEKKQQSDVNKLALFNKILNRVHVRIKTTSKQKMNDRCCWYVIPEIIIGVPKYDQAGCIAYVMDKLKNNGFSVRYIHPNTVFISWAHWVPSYVRAELKKKMGIIVDERGNVIEEINENNANEGDNKSNPNDGLFRKEKEEEKTGKKKQYASISQYKPSGNLIYTQDMLDKISK
jgi:hypothetical protein